MENSDAQSPDLGKSHECQILGRFGTMIQIFLGLLSFSVLLVKRYFEDPKRPLIIWLLDTSKQAFSCALAHWINMMLAILLSNAGESDNCEWYFINITVDVFLGVFLCYILLKGVEILATKYSFNMLHSGSYLKINKDKPYLTKETYNSEVTLDDIDIRNWIVQICAWGLIIVMVKLTLFSFQLLAAPVLERISTFLIGWVKAYPKVKLIVIMVIVPFILNAFQFWIQDNFLKLKKKNRDYDTELGLIDNHHHQGNTSPVFERKGNQFNSPQLNISRKTNGSNTSRKFN
ncbi:unnamed protein product [Moneuplotes crassus]|uniref:Vacuolar membrane protein n=1 Tax=Euplotes crassus TaxID=5936 RepID=A0AAD2D2F0_EUPCR|nr:unnamed protein product [Moneuplotes crassus]